MRRLHVMRTIGQSLATAVIHWTVLVPIGLAAFFVVPLLQANVREVLSSALLPGGSLLIPVSLPADRLAGFAFGGAFTLATYVLGALGVGAMCVAVWPSIAGNFDRPTLRSVYLDLRPRIGGVVRTGALVGMGVWLLQSVAGFFSSVAGARIATETDPAAYLRALNGAELTAQIAINVLVTAGVLFLFVRFFLAIPVVVFEGVAGRAALNRSRKLVHGNGWRVLAMLLVVGAVRQLGWTAVAALEFVPASVQAAPIWQLADEALRVVPALLGFLTLSLLALWMGSTYIVLREGTRVLDQDLEAMGEDRAGAYARIMQDAANARRAQGE